MKFSNFTKLLAIIFLMISFFSTKTLANYEKVFFDFSVELVNGKSIDLKEYKNKKAILLVNTLQVIVVLQNNIMICKIFGRNIKIKVY